MLAYAAAGAFSRWWAARGRRRWTRRVGVYALAAPVLALLLLRAFDSLDRWLPAL